MDKKNVLDALRNAKEGNVAIKLSLSCFPGKELFLKIIAIDDNGEIKAEQIEKSLLSFNVEDIISDIGVCSSSGSTEEIV